MKSRFLVILTIVAIVAVTVAIASQNCPVGKSDCQLICQRSGACELSKGCGLKNKETGCSKDGEKGKGCDKDKAKDPNCDPNSQK